MNTQLRWEYRVERATIEADDGAVMSLAGKEGWELASAFPDPLDPDTVVLYFKRPISMTTAEFAANAEDLAIVAEEHA